VGAVVDLAETWDVPVYAHESELPYLTGRARYPEPDPTVEGGWVAKLSLLFPRDPVNLGDRVRKLPPDGRVPGMPGWRWIPPPRPPPARVSLYRQADRALLGGDACVTLRQESLHKPVMQRKECSGPPRYWTPDWPSAREPVKRLHHFSPSRAITG